MRKLFSSSYLPLKREQLTDDFLAGLTFAVVNVPQGMANALVGSVSFSGLGYLGQCLYSATKLAQSDRQGGILTRLSYDFDLEQKETIQEE